ncbi:MAG TPA: VOC family protein [Streptosporangiaceae bacterium]|nr:VOC family protein [Streptosporangiaceae bacterium]
MRFQLVIDCREPELAELGATVIQPGSEGQDHYGVAMRDPEGNEFDVN